MELNFSIGGLQALELTRGLREVAVFFLQQPLYRQCCGDHQVFLFFASRGCYYM